MLTDVGMAHTLRHRLERMMPGTQSGMEASHDVAERTAATYLLVDKVARLTQMLERESDTALLAIAGWVHMPTRAPIPRI